MEGKLDGQLERENSKDAWKDEPIPGVAIDETVPNKDPSRFMLAIRTRDLWPRDEWVVAEHRSAGGRDLPLAQQPADCL